MLKGPGNEQIKNCSLEDKTQTTAKKYKVNQEKYKVILPRAKMETKNRQMNLLN